MATFLMFQSYRIHPKMIVMKSGLWWTGVLVLWAAVADAQAKKGTIKRDKKTTTTTTQKVTPAGNTTSIQHLISRGQYGAKGYRSMRGTSFPYGISDPTVNTFNQRANGAPIEFDGKSIIGVPKIVYGVGNGQILFRSRGATTSGTGTGTGTVGTGSSLGPIGTNGLSLGVNGKSPYAGPIMDGIIVTDVNKTQAATPKKEQNLKRQQNQ